MEQSQSVFRNERSKSTRTFSEGETVEIQNAEIEVAEAANPMVLFQPGVDLEKL